LTQAWTRRLREFEFSDLGDRSQIADGRLRAGVRGAPRDCSGVPDPDRRWAIVYSCMPASACVGGTRSDLRPDVSTDRRVGWAVAGGQLRSISSRPRDCVLGTRVRGPLAQLLSYSFFSDRHIYGLLYYIGYTYRGPLKILRPGRLPLPPPLGPGLHSHRRMRVPFTLPPRQRRQKRA
jgi:hypothetical protein